MSSPMTPTEQDKEYHTLEDAISVRDTWLAVEKKLEEGKK